jgi:hypothetical protein
VTHPWQVFPPEVNHESLMFGAGPAPSLAAAETYVGHHAAMTATVGVSSALGVVTAESYVGMGGTASEAALVSHNGEHLAFAEETLARAQIMHMAAAAHSATASQMVPAPVAHANRFEEAIDEAINPMVWGMLTPRITELNMEYFGFMWPNNAAAGLRYGATLEALGAALMAPSAPAISGGSIAAAAVAAASVAGSAAMSGMQAAVGMVGSGASAVAGPAAALPATAMSAASSPGSSVASARATSVPAHPLAAVTQSAPPTPAQTLAPAQSSVGMYAPSPNANLMTPPAVPPTTQAPVQPMMPRPTVTPPMSAAPGVTTFTPPAQPFSPPPRPSGGKAVGLKPGMLNASALRGPVSAMPAVTSSANAGLATASQPLAYVPPGPPMPPEPPPPVPPFPNPGETAHTLNPPQPQQQPPAHHNPPQHPRQEPQPQQQQLPANDSSQPSYQPGSGSGTASGGAQTLGFGPNLAPAPQAPSFPLPRDPTPPPMPVDPQDMSAEQAIAAWAEVNAEIRAWNARCGVENVGPLPPAQYNACIASRAPLLERQAAIRARLNELGIPAGGEPAPGPAGPGTPGSEPPPNQPGAPSSPSIIDQATQIGKDVMEHVPKGSRLSSLVDRLNQLHPGNQQQAADAAEAAAKAAWGESGGIVNGPTGAKLVLPADPRFGEAIMVAPDGTLSVFRGDLYQFLQ